MATQAVQVGLLLASTALLASAGTWINSRHRGHTATAFLVVLATLVGWTALTAVRLVPLSTSARIAAAYAAQPFLWAIPATWLLFALTYTSGGVWPRRSIRYGLGAWVVVTTLLTVTDPLHHLLWAGPTTVDAPFTYVRLDSRPAYWMLIAGTYAGILAGLGLLLRLSLLSRRTGRVQPALLVLAGVVPLTVDVLSSAAVLARPQFAYAPISLSVSVVAAGVALFRYRLFVVEPLARGTVLEEITEGVVVLDADRRVVDFNRAAETAFPDLSSLVGRPFTERYPTLLEDGAFVDRVTRFDGDDQRILSLRVTALESRGVLRGYVLVLLDVTDLTEATENYRRQTEQLDRFTGTISHDLRNPLAVAMGHVEVAHETGETRHLGPASKALDRMDQIIEDALQLARDGQAIEEMERVRLAAVAKAAWEMVATGPATLDVAVADDCEVYAHEGRLQRLFENLFRNAVEHAGSDAVVRVGLHETGFYVEDDGPGIPAEERASVFESGYSSDADGTGFGLAIVESISRAHGWTVGLDDGIEGGARFVFEGVQVLDAWTEESELVRKRTTGT